MIKRRFVISTSAGPLDTTNTLREALRIVTRAGGASIDDTKPLRRRHLRRPVYSSK